MFQLYPKDKRGYEICKQEFHFNNTALAKVGGGCDGLKGSGAGGRNWKSIRRLLQESREEIWRIGGDEEKEMQ